MLLYFKGFIEFVGLPPILKYVKVPIRFYDITIMTHWRHTIRSFEPMHCVYYYISFFSLAHFLLIISTKSDIPSNWH